MRLIPKFVAQNIATNRKKNFLLVLLVMFSIASLANLASPLDGYAAQDDASTSVKAGADSSRLGTLIRVALPIDSKESARVRRTLKQIAERSPAFQTESRPVVVLEFETDEGKTGRGSELESCMGLALYLGEAELNRIHTVAYIPASKTEQLDNDSSGQTKKTRGQLSGHAVLVAVAANQIVLAPEVAIGNAGIDDQQLKPLFRDVYRNVAEQSQRLPVPMVMSMLDRQLQLFRVTKSDGSVHYVDDVGLANIESSDLPTARTLSHKGEFGQFTGNELKEFGLISLTPESRSELARDLNLSANSLESTPADGKDWKAIQLDLPDVIDRGAAKWIVDSLNQQVGRGGVNLVILNFDSSIGDVDACLKIAQKLAEFPEEIRTVAFVKGKAQGPVGLVALSCRNLIMSPVAILGGQDDLAMSEEVADELSAEDLDTIRPLVKTLAQELQTDWSVMMQMIDPRLAVWKYQHKQSGQVRLLSNEEFESSRDAELWVPVSQVGGVNGIDALTAKSNRLSRMTADDIGQIQQLFQLDQEPPSMRRSATNRWAERLAEFLSSPFVAPWLIVLAMFFFSTEMSAPGLGLPGFLAAICFLLFFWSQSLDGDADWLEILMFVVGVIFIVLEIFVLPGFGIFGIGGIVLVISSLVLASQSFLIPRSPEEFVQMAYSLLPVIGAGTGIICGAIVMRKLIPHSPFLRRMILVPREPIDTGLGGHDPEAMVDWSHLSGDVGTTITRLAPSGKARIAGKVYDVISKGQMISKDEPIEVIEVIGNRIVVQETNSVD